MRANEGKQAFSAIRAAWFSEGTLQRPLGPGLFVPFLVEERQNPAPEIEQILQSINDLIEENNERSKSLAQDQRNARRALRLHEIASYIAEIDLAAEDAGICEVESKKRTLPRRPLLLRQGS